MKQHIAVVGAGFSGAVLARELANSGKYRISLFEEKSHVGGNCHTYRDDETGVMVHQNGPHIFHTDQQEIWDYINLWGRFEPYIDRVKAQTKEGIFSIPINLLTLNQFFNTKMNPKEARDYVGSLSAGDLSKINSCEDYGKKYFGTRLYKIFFDGFLKKFWGLSPTILPKTLLEKSSIRFNYEDKYFDNRFQGIPVSGYTEIIKRILDHPEIEVRLNQNFTSEKVRDFDHLFWSGPLDAFFDYSFGKLSYRTIHSERMIETGDYQGNAIIHFCDEEVPFARTCEHKHLAPWEVHEKTIVFKEFIRTAEIEDSQHYPLRLEEDLKKLELYIQRTKHETGVTFIGRLGTYRYLDMELAIAESLDLAKFCLSRDLGLWPKMGGPLSP